LFNGTVGSGYTTEMVFDKNLSNVLLLYFDLGDGVSKTVSSGTFKSYSSSDDYQVRDVKVYGTNTIASTPANSTWTHMVDLTKV